MRIFLFLFAWLALPVAIIAQRAEGKFLNGKAKLGEPIRYALWMRHDPALEVLFPDSAYSFAPFELLDKQHFPTKTTAAGSLDSVVYILATYELDPVQSLSLPVWVIDKKAEGGKRAFYANLDSIQLEEIIPVMPDTLQLKEQSDMLNMKKQFNYPYLLIGIGILLLSGLFVALLFGKTIRRNWKIRSLRKKHLRFILDFDRMMSEINSKNLEHAIAFWKQYTSGLVGLPFASYTTKEIKGILKEDAVIAALEQSDRVIYGGIEAENLKDILRALKGYSQECFDQTISRIRAGNKA